MTYIILAHPFCMIVQSFTSRKHNQPRDPFRAAIDTHTSGQPGSFPNALWLMRLESDPLNTNAFEFLFRFILS